MNKHVLVTGADGFIGSHLVEALLKKGFKVRALSFYNSFNSWGWLDSLDPNANLEVVSGDIRDSGFCRSITSEIDTVFHLAALIAIPYSYVAPESYIQTNVLGTLNMLNAARDNGVKNFLNTSTSEVYGTAKFVPIPETHPLQPQSPYSASKIGADSLALSYWNSFQFPVTVVRPFNTFGPRQSARAVIPTIISQLASGVKKIRLGDCRPTRDFNFVEDICRGFIAVSQKENLGGETINLCTGEEISIGRTFEVLCDLMNVKVSLEEDSERLRPSGSEVFRLLGDNSKAKDLIGYSPETSFQAGLEKTIAWFTNSENLKKYRAHLYNV